MCIRDRDYLEKNRGLLSGRPQSFQHGDYHVGNMMLAGTELVLIDFDRSDFGADLTIVEEANEFVGRVKNGGVLPMITSRCV